MHTVLCRHVFTSLGYTPRSTIAGSCDKPASHLEELANCFPKQMHHLHSYQQYVRGGSNFSTLLLTLFIICLFYYGHLSGSQVELNCAFDLHFPKINDLEHLFICFFAVCVSSVEKCLLRSLVFNWAICIFN